MSYSELIAVMRRDGALAADYGLRHHVPRWYHDADALIADSGVNAVYIATPPAYHKDYVLRAAAAGKPVYVEKPMGMTHTECMQMVHACERAGVPLFVAYYRRALPRFELIARLLESGAIGELRYARVQLSYVVPPAGYNRADLPWRVIPEISGGGFSVDLASHTRDILEYLLGPIADVSGYASNQAGLYRAEDMVSGAFRFASGVHAVGTWCFASYQRSDVAEIVGSDGRLTFSVFGAEPIRCETPAGVIEHAVDQPAHVQQPLIQTIVDHLLGKGHCHSTGRSAARANWVMDQLLAEYRRHWSSVDSGRIGGERIALSPFCSAGC